MTNRTIAYHPVTIRDHDPQLQFDELARHGYDLLFTETTYRTRDRPQLTAALAALRPGDTFLFWRSIRLAADTTQLLDLITHLHGLGAKIVSLTEDFDPGTDQGRITLHALALSAQYATEQQAERRATASRRHAPPAPARRRGAPGRPRIVGPAELTELRRLINEHGMSVPDAARTLRIGRSTAYQALRNAK